MSILVTGTIDFDPANRDQRHRHGHRCMEADPSRGRLRVYVSRRPQRPRPLPRQRAVGQPGGHGLPHADAPMAALMGGDGVRHPGRHRRQPHQVGRRHTSKLVVAISPVGPVGRRRPRRRLARRATGGRRCSPAGTAATGGQPAEDPTRATAPHSSGGASTLLLGAVPVHPDPRRSPYLLDSSSRDIWSRSASSRHVPGPGHRPGRCDPASRRCRN